MVASMRNPISDVILPLIHRYLPASVILNVLHMRLMCCVAAVKMSICCEQVLHDRK